MIKNNFITTGALFGVLAVTAYFNSAPTVHTMDLLSTSIENCDIKGQLDEKGEATCEDLKVGKMKGRATVKLLKGKEKKDDRVEVQTEVNCETCREGTRSANKKIAASRDVAKFTIEMFASEAKASAKEAADEKERLRKVAICEIEDDEDQTPIKGEAKQLACMNTKLAEMDPEKRDEYYQENMRNRLHALVTSGKAHERKIAMDVLGNLGEKLNINCATRPSMQQTNNAFLTHSNLNPQMAEMRPLTKADGKSGSFVTESSCDMWGFATYMNSVEYLRVEAARPNANKNMIQQAYAHLKSGWGNYYAQRDLQIQTDITAFNGTGLSLGRDLEDMNKSMDYIVKRHRDLLEVPQTTADNAGARSGRYGRGGPGPSQPWATTPGTQAPAVQQQQRPVNSAPNGFRGAPAAGTGGSAMMVPQSQRCAVDLILNLG